MRRCAGLQYSPHAAPPLANRFEMDYGSNPVRSSAKEKNTPKEALHKEVSLSSEKEYIQNGGNPCKIRISAAFYACLPIICGINLQADSLDNLCR